MKTIFIPLFSGVEAKNIIRTGVYDLLREEHGVRIVLLFRNAQLADVYRAMCANPETTIVVLPPFVRTRAERFFSRLKMYLLRTKTVDLRRRVHYEENGSAARFAFSLLFNRAFARSWFRRIARFADKHLVMHKEYATVFEEYRPDLIFLADLFDDQEAALLGEAKRRGVLSVGLVNTWDRVTTRWMLRHLPDRFIAFNEIVRAELAEYADMPVERVRVCGTVQHDHLVRGPFAKRGEFLSSLGLPQDARFVLYAPLGAHFDTTRPELDRALVSILAEWFESGAFNERNLYLLVRFHPNDPVHLEEWPKHPRIVYDIPGVKFREALPDARFARTRGQNWDMTESDLARLRNSLHYASAVVCYYTSLSIDAAVAGVPVININFDIKDGKEISRMHPYYQSTHYQKAAATGGIRLVGSLAKLRTALGEYITNPERDRASRERLTSEQCYRLDGNSDRRLASEILAVLPR